MNLRRQDSVNSNSTCDSEENHHRRDAGALTDQIISNALFVEPPCEELRLRRCNAIGIDEITRNTQIFESATDARAATFEALHNAFGVAVY